MKEICEKIFCFWKKWCKKKDNSYVSIESSKLISSEKKKDNYSNITHIQQIENTSFKEKKKEIEMSTALPII